MPATTTGERKERATASKLIKFERSELERIERHAKAAGVPSSKWIKQWLAQVCDSLDKQASKQGV